MIDGLEIGWHFLIRPQIEMAASDLWAALNTPIALTLIGTGVAAFAGVMGAHSITEKYKRRDQLLAELRSTNSAIMTAFEIGNSMLNLKNQQVQKLSKKYQEDKTRFEDFESKRRANELPTGSEFVIEADFQTINPMLNPDEFLMKQVHEKLSPPARAYALTSVLCRTIDSLNRSIHQRNVIIETWKEQSAHRTYSQNTRLLLPLYFGTSTAAGHTDLSYSQTMEAIHHQLDDCIQFSNMLALDLHEHGATLKDRLGKGAPDPLKIDFDKAAADGLMPDQKKYEDWVNGFQTKAKSRWWQFTRNKRQRKQG